MAEGGTFSASLCHKNCVLWSHTPRQIFLLDGVSSRIQYQPDNYWYFAFNFLTLRLGRMPAETQIPSSLDAIGYSKMDVF